MYNVSVCVLDYTNELIYFDLNVGGKNQEYKKCQVKLKSSYSELTLKSKELANKALEEANRFQSISKYPSVVIVMKHAYVKHGYLVRSYCGYICIVKSCNL